MHHSRVGDILPAGITPRFLEMPISARLSLCPECMPHRLHGLRSFSFKTYLEVSELSGEAGKQLKLSPASIGRYFRLRGTATGSTTKNGWTCWAQDLFLRWDTDFPGVLMRLVKGYWGSRIVHYPPCHVQTRERDCKPTSNMIILPYYRQTSH